MHLQRTIESRTIKESIRSLIEADNFPIDFISTLALKESWRKEVYRPVYHIHKWWANRLGSVFRGILIGCITSPSTDFKKAFYSKTEHPGVSVFDPFMGSGTTIGEAHKLGCTAIGRDINAIACESVRVALSPLHREKLLGSFKQLSEGVGEKIKILYTSQDKDNKQCDVLYFFWVKQIPCPACQLEIDLFPSYIFAKNAYPNRKPLVQIYCPKCENIFSGLNHNETAKCTKCFYMFNPHSGPAHGSKATCTHCSNEFSIINIVRNMNKKPKHKLYAKLILTTEGNKQYLKATEDDKKAYTKCSKMLRVALSEKKIKLPSTKLAEGYNTKQAINYNYLEWLDFFNDRQLLALGWLHDAILKIRDETTRDALLLLFSGILEFNNMFTSYKGEGTGAVRHMFSHHILKPERMPIEANIWGTPKSSGSFLNLFKSRLLRAIDYKENPFEVSTNNKIKTVTCSKSFTGNVQNSFPSNMPFRSGGIYLSCGSSDKTELPEKSVDYVVTDPPFFDNVHYSELADFFYSWQRLHPHGFIKSSQTTRTIKEVQDTKPEEFARKLKYVFKECNRVLKDNGLLVFTYHHSRSEGWAALAEAIYGSGFILVNTHPIKSEMSVATPKSQSKSPIQLDIIFVCRKNNNDNHQFRSPKLAIKIANEKTQYKVKLLRSTGLNLSRNDIRVILYSQFLVSSGSIRNPNDAFHVFDEQFSMLDSMVDDIELKRLETVESTI